jgi:hypothetical protein
MGVAATLVLLPATFSLDDVARGGQLGPGFWPRLILVGLALACAGRATLAWLRTWAASKGPPSPPDARARAAGPGARLDGIAVPTLLAAVTLIVLYVLATPVAGFAFTTIAFIAAFMWLAGSRSTAALAGCALGGTVLLLYVFVKVVYLPLPKGTGPFEPLTVALYRALRIF